MAAPRPVKNPPNPYESTSVEWEGPPPDVKLEVFEEHARSIVAENESPDVGFRFSVNPYRGCFHGCAYCYARPTHQYLGFGAGTDFDRKIVVKVNAPELLARELVTKRALRGETIAFSGNTDCYQPLEASYALTRRCLELCLAHRQRIGIITKGHVIRRDVALLGEMAARGLARVTISIAFSDDATGLAFDPYAPPIRARFETMRRLAEAGVPVGVGVSPIVPGVNDSCIPDILARAKEAGARHAFMTLVRLAREVLPVFEARLEEVVPLRSKKIRSSIRELRGGATSDSRFGERMRGQGARWDVIEQLFDTHVRRLGLNEERPVEPEPEGQLELF
ncbi:MAG: radical SAM protein [Sandaracinaceae bacterium]|nr:radical SAM protein [Sandaracinaceae bacterium]